MIIIKKPLTANFKPLQTVGKDLTTLPLPGDRQQEQVMAPEMFYKPDSQGQGSFAEIILNLLLQIRNLNYNQSFLINNSASLKRELIKQLKSHLTQVSWHKTEHTQEVHVLQNNINNTNFFLDNNNLDAVIDGLNVEVKKNQLNRR